MPMPMKTHRRMLFTFAALGSLAALRTEAPEPDAPTVEVAVFDVDVTPPLGSMMAYDPVKRIDELDGLIQIEDRKPCPASVR